MHSSIILMKRVIYRGSVVLIPFSFPMTCAVPVVSIHTRWERQCQTAVGITAVGITAVGITAVKDLGFTTHGSGATPLLLLVHDASLYKTR
jgi:hypothetical protein